MDNLNSDSVPQVVDGFSFAGIKGLVLSEAREIRGDTCSVNL